MSTTARNKCKENLKSSLKLRLVTLAAIYTIFTYLYNNYLNVMRDKCYGDVKDDECRGHVFSQESVMLMYLSLIYAASAKVVMLIMNRFPGFETKNTRKLSKQMLLVAAVCLGLSYTFDLLAQEVSSSTEITAFSSSLPLAVMISCLLLSTRRYEIQKYFIVISIIIGLFMILNGSESTMTYSSGILFLALYALLFGISFGLQEKIKLTTNPSALSFMLWINLFIAVIYTIPVTMYDEFFNFFVISIERPDLYLDIGIMAIFGGVVNFIGYLLIVDYGVVTFVTVYVTQNFFNPIIESIVDGKKISKFFENFSMDLRVIGIVILLSGLLVDLFYGDEKIFGNKREQTAVTDEVNGTEMQNLNQNNNEKEEV